MTTRTSAAARTSLVALVFASLVLTMTSASSQQGINPKNKVIRKGPVLVVPRNNPAPRNLRVITGPNNTVIRGQGLRGPAVGFRGPVGAVTFRGVRANFIRGRHRFFRNGRYIPFVALGTIAAIAVGSRYYSPYAFVDGPRGETCAGPTDDGMCELRMTEVPLEDGTAEMQCVSYCPQ